jgi:hypothetical protein
MGGSNEDMAFHDTWVLDTEQLSWECMTLRCWFAGMLPMQQAAWYELVCRLSAHLHGPICRNGATLLQRTAHSCIRHPHERNAFLVFGGFGRAGPASQVLDFKNDIILVETSKCAAALKH